MFKGLAIIIGSIVFVLGLVFYGSGASFASNAPGDYYAKPGATMYYVVSTKIIEGQLCPAYIKGVVDTDPEKWHSFGLFPVPYKTVHLFHDGTDEYVELERLTYNQPVCTPVPNN